MVNALWIADFYATLIESRTAEYRWNEMYGDSMLSGDRKNFGPAYYGLQMLHVLAHPREMRCLMSVRAVACRRACHLSPRWLCRSHAGQQRPQVSGYDVKVTFKNGRSAQPESASSTAARSSTPARRYGNSFTATGNELEVTIPPYTITDIVLPRQN